MRREGIVLWRRNSHAAVLLRFVPTGVRLLLLYSLRPILIVIFSFLQIPRRGVSNRAWARQPRPSPLTSDLRSLPPLRPSSLPFTSTTPSLHSLLEHSTSQEQRSLLHLYYYLTCRFLPAFASQLFGFFDPSVTLHPSLDPTPS